MYVLLYHTFHQVLFDMPKNKDVIFLPNINGIELFTK